MARAPTRSEDTIAGDSPSLDALPTEAGGEPDAGYELRSTAQLVALMQEADAGVPTTVASASKQISTAIDAVVERLERGGRLVYAGAGSSGRVAALDASECESTFGTTQVLALVAGGATAPALEQEAAEDDRAGGRAEAAAVALRAEDAVVGVSASGRTPWVLGVVEAAREAGSATACVVCAESSELARLVDHEILVAVGPEFIAGSTRLKAGTAQKLVLNTISTVSMIRLGKTFGNLMVDVVATNDKLRARVRRIVRTATGASGAEVDAALAAAGGSAKVAIVSILSGVDAETARARLDACGRDIRRALERSGS